MSVLILFVLFLLISVCDCSTLVFLIEQSGSAELCNQGDIIILGAIDLLSS